MKWKGASPIFILIFYCYLFCLVQGPKDDTPPGHTGASSSGHTDHHGSDSKGTSNTSSAKTYKHTDKLVSHTANQWMKNFQKNHPERQFINDPSQYKNPEIEDYLNDFKNNAHHKYIAQMLDDTEYDYPKPFKGIVLPKKDGDKKPRTKNPFTLFARKPEGDHWDIKEFKSNSESIESIMLYTQLKLEYVKHMEDVNGKKKAKHGDLYKELMELKKSMPKEGIQLIFNVQEKALTSALLLEKGVKNVEKEEEKEEWDKPVYFMDRNDEKDPDVEDDDDDDDDDDEDPDETSTFTVMVGIMLGEDGFGDEKKCYLDLNGLSEYKPKEEEDSKPGFITRQRKKLLNIAKTFFKKIWNLRKKKKLERLMEEANKQAAAAGKKPVSKGNPGEGDPTVAEEDDDDDNREEDVQKNFLASIKSKALKLLSESKLIQLAKQGWKWFKRIGFKLDPQEEAEMEAEFGEADPLLAKDKTEPGENKFVSYLRSWIWRTEAEKQKENDRLLGYGKILEDVKAQGNKVAEELKQDEQAKGSVAPDHASLKRLKETKIHPWKLFKGVRLYIDARPGRYKKLNDDEFELVKKSLGLTNKFEDVLKRLAKEDEERKKKADAPVMQEKMDSMSENVGKILGDLNPSDKKAQEKAKKAKEEFRKEILLCNPLGTIIETVLYELGESDEAAEDMKGRIGAQIINGIINKKDLNGLAAGMSFSLLGTSIIVLILDAWLWPMIILHTAPFLGPYATPFAIMLYSWTPQFAETFDSMVIKRVIAVTRGAKRFVPKKGKRMAVFQDALRAGSVAAIGSVFNNGMEYAGTGLNMLAPTIIANIIATSTSASMIPFEIENSFIATFDNTVQKYKTGFYKRPDLKDFLVEKEEIRNKKWWNRAKNLVSRNKTTGNSQKTQEILDHWDDPNKVTWRKKKALLIEYVQHKTDRIMDFAKTSGMNRNSLSFGIMISTGIGYLMPYFLNYFGIIAVPASVIRIFLMILNAPTEILSMGLDKIASAKWGWDATKYRRMIKLIVDKGIDKLVDWKAKKEAGAKLEKIGKIADQEIHHVHYANLFLKGVNVVGKGVVTGMKHTFKVVFPLFSMLGKVFAMLGKGVGIVAAQLAKLPFLQKTDSFISKAMREAKLVFTDMMERPVVPNYLPDMVYIVQHPRTSTAPSLSPMSLKLETWLKLRGVRFYRMTHGIFLTALFTEKLPYVELNGKKFRGTTDDIISELEKHFFLQEEAGDQDHTVLDLRNKVKVQIEERRIRRHFDEVVHKSYMHEFMNASLVYEKRTVKSVVSDGTIRKKFRDSFLTTDEAIMRKMIPALPIFFPKLFYAQFGIWPIRTRMPIPHQKAFWDDFFSKKFQERLTSGRINFNTGKFFAKNNGAIPSENKTFLEMFSNTVDDKMCEMMYRAMNGNNGRKPLSNDKTKWIAYVKNLKEKKIPLIHGKMMRRIRRKVLDVLRKDKYREYDAKNDIWKLKTVPKVSILKNPFATKSKTPQSPASGGQTPPAGELTSKDAHKGTSDGKIGSKKQAGHTEANRGTVPKPTRRKRQTGDKHAPGKSDDDKHVHAHSSGDHKEEKKEEKKQKTKPVYFKDIEGTLQLSYTKMILEAMDMVARRLEKTEKELSGTRKGKKNHDSDKLYLFGDKPTPADASVFAQLALFIEIREHFKESNKDLHDYFTKIEKKEDKDHILWNYFQKIKEEWGTVETKNDGVAGHEPAWDNVKKTWTLNYEKMWDVDETKLGDKYQGPYGFVYKGAMVDEGEWASRDNQDDDDQGGEEDEEEEESRDHQEKIDNIHKTADGQGAEAKNGESNTAGKKPGDAKKDPKDTSKNGQEDNYLGPEFTNEELHKFLPMTPREAWKKLVKNGILFEKVDDDGNFLYNYPRIYAYITQKLFKMAKHDLMVEKSDSQEKLIQPDLPFEYGLEGTEKKLTGYISIMKGELNKFDNSMAGRLARVLVHVMAANDCEGEFTESEAKDICEDQYEEDILGKRNDQLHWSVTVRLCLMEVEKKKSSSQSISCKAVHHAIAFGQLSKIYKNNAKEVNGKRAVPAFNKNEAYFAPTYTALSERMNQLDKDVVKLVKAIKDNFNKLVNPDYEMEELDRFKPIEEDKLIHIDENNHYSANEITLFYYPDIFAYIVLELLKLANDSKEITPLKLMKLERGLKDDIFYGLEDVEKEIKEALKDLTQPSGYNLGRERVVKAMFHFVAAFLCEIGDEGDKCGKHHRKLAEEKLKTNGKLPTTWIHKHDLNQLVKTLAHKIITNFNENIAEEELNKFGTKIAAEIETLPKGPGFFSMISSKIASIFTPSKQMPEIEKEFKKWEGGEQEGGESGTVSNLHKANSAFKEIVDNITKKQPSKKETADSDVSYELLDDDAHGTHDDVDDLPVIDPPGRGMGDAGVSPSS